MRQYLYFCTSRREATDLLLRHAPRKRLKHHKEHDVDADDAGDKRVLPGQEEERLNHARV
jgi:hypothetical protein